MIRFDKRVLNIFAISLLSFLSFTWTFWIFHKPFELEVVFAVIGVRILASITIYRDYALSWSKATPKTFLIKSVVYIAAFAVYMPLFYSKIHVYFLLSELFTFLFFINLLMYAYAYYINRGHVEKNKAMVIYGAGKAGMKIVEELRQSPYRVRFFVDDNELLHGRSLDGVPIVSGEELQKRLDGEKADLLVIAIPSAPQKRIREIYERLNPYFEKIKILPALHSILLDRPYSRQLKDISVGDLLARRPKDLDAEKISSFVKGKCILITGAGGSIGSEIVRQCIRYGARKLILLDHSEYNLYQIKEEIGETSKIVCVLQSVVHKERIEKTFSIYRPEIVIHAAAYKHVPICEQNPEAAVLNNIIGTQNVIDVSIAHKVQKVVIISTDKAVRPTNVMGATKRVTELYAQNIPSDSTEIVAVRFGNVLASSGSVIPKFKEQIAKGGPVTVTHPEITRYFMLIPEACQLVLQAGAMAEGGELFILDMGEPVKIVDLAKKMIELSGRSDIEIIFTGLRPGEKLYEELLIDEAECRTKYESIYVASPSSYPIEILRHDIENLLQAEDLVAALQKIVPEFTPDTMRKT